MKILLLSFFNILTHTAKSVRAYSILSLFVFYLKLNKLFIKPNIMTKEKFNKIVNVVCALISAIGAAISTLLN